MAEVLHLSPRQVENLSALEFQQAVAYLDDRNERLSQHG